MQRIKDHLMKHIPYMSELEVRTYLNIDKYLSDKELVDKILEILDTKEKLEKFFNFFKRELAITGYDLQQVLNLTETERKDFIKEGYFTYLFSMNKYVKQYRKKITIKLFDSWQVLNLSPQDIEQMRKRRNEKKTQKRKQGSKQATETKKKLKELMPDWLKDKKLRWVKEIDSNLKRLALVAKLSDESDVDEASFYFGNLLFDVKIDSALNARCLLMLSEHIKKMSDLDFFGRLEFCSDDDDDEEDLYEEVMELVNMFNFMYRDKLTFKVVSRNVTKSFENHIRNLLNRMFLTNAGNQFHNMKAIVYHALEKDFDKRVMVSLF